jgi:hypothetical protein
MSSVDCVWLRATTPRSVAGPKASPWGKGSTTLPHEEGSGRSRKSDTKVLCESPLPSSGM